MESIRDSYVERFDAMISDLRNQLGEDLSIEASQHAEDGSIIFDPDDELPRRVDCATPGGDEYNLETGEPLPPSSNEEFSDYPFRVRVHPACWEAMAVTVKFQESLSDGQWEDFDALLRGWYLAGFWGAYSGFLHSLRGLNYGGRVARCVVDLGSAELMALHNLLHALAGFGGESVEIEKVSLGEAPTLVS